MRVQSCGMYIYRVRRFAWIFWGKEGGIDSEKGAVPVPRGWFLKLWVARAAGPIETAVAYRYSV